MAVFSPIPRARERTAVAASVEADVGALLDEKAPAVEEILRRIEEGRARYRKASARAAEDASPVLATLNEDQLKGLQKLAPVMAGVFTIVMLSSIGVPGLNGFAGEFGHMMVQSDGLQYHALVVLPHAFLVRAARAQARVGVDRGGGGRHGLVRRRRRAIRCAGARR